MSSEISTEAEQWFGSGNWKGGLSLDADAATDVEEFYKQYHANQPAWDKAFNFLKTQDLQNLKPGKHEIDGDEVYASVSEAVNMDYDQTTWESHKKYNDIQYVVSGEEQIGITTADKTTITKEYDQLQDIMFYTGEGKTYSFQPANFFIFFPTDIHRPGIKGGTDLPAKKVVLKVKTAV